MAAPRTLKEYQEARRAARAAEQTAPLPGSAVARIQREAALDQAETRQDQMTDIMENTQYDAQKGQASPAVLRHNREAMVQAPAPDETTVPTMTWAEMSKRARELGVRPQSLGWAGLKGVGLVAGENKLHGTLKEMEEFAPGDVEGSTWAAQAFGAADKLQRGLTRGAQALYDPLDDERSRLLEGQRKRREAVAKTGAMIPPALLQRDIEELADLERRVTGVQSYTREVHKDAGKAMPLQAVMDSNLTSKALSVPVRAQAMFNSAQADVADMLPHGKPMLPPDTAALPRNEAERVAREIARTRAPKNPGEAAAMEDGGVLNTWANEDRKRAKELNQTADTLQEGLPLEWFKNLPREEQVRVGGMAGEVEGELQGNVLQTGLPTALTGGMYAAAKAGPVLMNHAVSPAVRYVAKSNLDNPTVKKLVGKFVQNPAALTLGPAGADAALLAENTARTAPDLMQRQLVEDMATSYPPFGSLTQADKQSILSFQRPKSMAGGAVFDVLQEAQRVRHDPALQAKASTPVQDLLENWTPREVQLAKDVGIPEPGPFHPEYGQDITQSGGVLQTRAAVDRAEQAARVKGGPVIDDLQARVRDVSPEEFAASPSGVGLMKSGLATYRQVREPAVEAALKELTAAERSLVDTLPEAAIPGILSRRDMLRRVSQGQGTDADLAELVVAKTGTTQRVGDRVARSVEAEGDRARRAVDDVVGKMDRGLDEQAKVAAKGMEGATLAERETLERLDNLARQSSGIAARSAEGQANRLRTDIFKRLQDQRTQAYQADAALRDAGDAHMDQARTTQWKFMEGQKFPDKGRAGAAPHLAEDFPRAMQPAVREAGTKARAAVDDVVNTTQRAINKQRNLAGDNLADMANAEREALDKMSGTVIRRADSAAERIGDVSERARAEIYRRMTQQQYNTGRTLERQADAAEGAMEGARGRQWRFMEGQKTAGEALDDFSPAQKAAEDKVMDALGISREKAFKTADGMAESRQDVVRRLARQMMAAPRESAFTQDMGNELRAWAGLPPKEFTAAELREAEKYATTVATRRTGGAVKALEEAGTLPLSEVTGVRLKTGIPASESLDLLQRQISSGRAPNKAVLEELKQVTDGSNIFAGANATAKRSGRGLVAKQFAETFTHDLPAMRADKPTSFRFGEDYLDGLRMKYPGVDLSDVKPSVLARDFEGAVREGKPYQLPEKLRELLVKEDDVLVSATPRGNGQKAMLDDSEMLRAVDALSGDKSPAIIRYQAPSAEAAANIDGMFIPRWYAKALIEGQSAAVAAQSHGELAKALNKWVGAARMNYAFTVGRPGFQAKNMFNNTSRALADEPKAQQSVPLLMRIMKAPLRDATPIPELGMTAGQAHRLLLETSGAGHGWLDEATKSFQEMPRSAFHDAVAARSPRAAKAMDALPDAVMGAGALENKATDLAFQVALFGERLPPGYTAEDGLKMLLAVHKMKRGVAPAEVARQVQRALINFGAQNAFQQEWKFFIPFMKYYTGAMEGAAYLTAKNPEQLRWLNRYVEANQAYDRGTHDQRALSPRLRTDGEAAGFQPMVRDESGALRTYMLDTVVNEGGQLLDTARAGLAPEPGERGIMGLAGPWIGDSVAQVTGKQPGTDRWVVPFSDENQARAAQLNALERWGPLARANMPMAMALELIEHPEQYRTDPLSDSGKAALAYYALRYTPLVSQFGSQPIVAALSKWVLGVRGNNPASATEEARGEEIARTLTRWFTGAGITPIDPVKRQAAQSNKARKQMIETPVGIEDRLRDSGRASE